MPTAPLSSILLVEDNPADVDLTREAFRETGLDAALTVAKDGLEALAILRGEAGRPPIIPDLILLDLNMPRMDGRELLAVLRDDPALSSIPVLVMTTSMAETDLVKSYSLSADCYIQKPVDFDRFLEVAREIEAFWQHHVEFRNG